MFDVSLEEIREAAENANPNPKPHLRALLGIAERLEILIELQGGNIEIVEDDEINDVDS